MTYELGQQAALEKVGIFNEWAENRPRIRAPHVKGVGWDAHSATTDLVASMARKYGPRAPKTVAHVSRQLEDVAAKMNAPEVYSVRIGGPRGDRFTESGHSYYSRGDRAVGLNADSVQGTFAHELGHALPGQIQKDRLYDLPYDEIPLPEEARATKNYIKALGRDHPDVPDLLGSFGTYVQNAVETPRSVRRLQEESTPAVTRRAQRMSRDYSGSDPRSPVRERRRAFAERVLRRNPEKPLQVSSFAALTGPDRAEFNSWLSAMGAKIDEYFWPGAGNVAISRALEGSGVAHPT